MSFGAEKSTKFVIELNKKKPSDFGILCFKSLLGDSELCLGGVALCSLLSMIHVQNGNRQQHLSRQSQGSVRKYGEFIQSRVAGLIMIIKKSLGESLRSEDSLSDFCYGIHKRT